MNIEKNAYRFPFKRGLASNDCLRNPNGCYRNHWVDQLSQ